MKTLLTAILFTGIGLAADPLQIGQEVTAASGLQVLVMPQQRVMLPVLGLYSVLGPGVMVFIKNQTADPATTYFQVTAQRTDGRPVTAIFPRSNQPYSAYVLWVDPTKVSVIQIGQEHLMPAPAGLGPAVELQQVSDLVELDAPPAGQ